MSRRTARWSASSHTPAADHHPEKDGRRVCRRGRETESGGEMKPFFAGFVIIKKKNQTDRWIDRKIKEFHLIAKLYKKFELIM